MATENPYRGYKCPVCRARDIETVVRIPAIRGYVLGYRYNTRRFPSCAPCGRKEMLKEAGLSMVMGWFSPTALIVNPFLILWNLGRGPFVGRDYAAVKALFVEAGIPDPGERPDLLKVLYGLATAMITADGRIEPEEISVALALGGRVSPEFDPRAFHHTVENHASLPSVEEYASVLGGALEEGQKRLVISYLAAIALADGDFAGSEERLLRGVAERMGVGSAWLKSEIEGLKARARAARDTGEEGGGQGGDDDPTS